MNWYRLGVKDIFDHLATAENGLTAAEVIERLARYRPNKLAEEEKISKTKILIHQFKSPLIYILLIAGLVTLLLQEYIDSGVIFVVVIPNAVIGFIQELKAEESVRALKNMVVQKARVIRDGRERELNGEELVPGDIVVLSSGAKVPAEKAVSVMEEDNLTPGDQNNMAFMGTVVVHGRAKGIVVATGSQTTYCQGYQVNLKTADLAFPI